MAEMEYMIESVLCAELGYLEKWLHDYRLSPKGLLRLEARPNQIASTGLCAMWFDIAVKPLFDDVIRPAIRDAGYDELRIDAKEHNGRIDDEIVASIRSARFVVADFTGHRGGVYYEAGFAHGLGLPVLFMCREDEAAQLHFDIRQYNCILWRNDLLGEAKRRLQNRILATIGQGPIQH